MRITENSNQFHSLNVSFDIDSISLARYGIPLYFKITEFQFRICNLSTSIMLRWSQQVSY